MEEKFIEWLNNFKEFKEGSPLRKILDDAIKCYKCDIPRPSLMLSYTAFISAVKDNILNSEKPSNISKEKWDTHLEKLRDDKEWDEEVLTCIKINSLGNKIIFNIPQSLRDSVVYWKNKRNDCAHYKDENITLSHVSAFWIFLMDNYNKFTPLGSMQQCINEYNQYFDISKTPKGADQSDIFNRLCLAIHSENDLLFFIKNIFWQNLDDLNDIIYKLLHMPNIREFAKRLLIKTESEKLLKVYLQKYPSDVSTILSGHEEAIRSLWYSAFEKNTSSYPSTLIFSELLKANMIPPQEINESIKSFLKCCYTLNFCPNEKELTFLTNTYKLYDIFLDNYLKKEFVCVSPGDKCQKLIFFIGFIKIGGITKHFVEILSDSLQSSFPYTLRDQIRTYLSEKKNKSIYIDLCNDLQIVPYFNFDSTDKNTSIQNL